MRLNAMETRRPFGMLCGFAAMGFFLLVSGCTGNPDQSPVEAKVDTEASAKFEGSQSKGMQAGSGPVFAEGSGSKEAVAHPDLDAAEKVSRLVVVPQVVQGKWKAVKLLIKDKTDEENTTMKTVPLGESFTLGDSGLKVSVGPFFPNFVMGKDTYTSMNNKLINPAVQLIVEEKGKIVYKGWAFSRYPTMYAFEHDVYALELKDFIPTEVS